MRLKSTLIFIALLAFSGLAAACPDGYYAVEGPDMTNCYPIPGEERARGEMRDEQPSQPSQPQQKQQKWVDTWGAIAIGNSTVDGAGVIGAATGMTNERQASNAALAQCKEKSGGQTCKIRAAYYNQCAVVLWGDTGNYVSHAATVEIATEMSMNTCNAQYANCSVYYWGCSPAKRVF
jgi:hypothetical protein